MFIRVSIRCVSCFRSLVASRSLSWLASTSTSVPMPSSIDVS